MNRFDYTVVGGGIVGLATARQIHLRFPNAKVLVLEKESAPARHQTGRNSGVIHSGIYYQPGSFKARFARAGAQSMVRFCQEHDIAHEVCGKLIVATRDSELPQLEKLYHRAQENGVPAEKLSREAAQEIEPHVNCLQALRISTTGITSYVEVCREYLRQIESAGGTVQFDQQVVRITEGKTGEDQVIETASAEFASRFVINCAGLHSDRVARSAGADPQARIVPFRGEYFELAPERRHLVKHLIYPVPNPDFPFLGVHFTRMIDGSVHAGPNAVLALAREGYEKTDFDLRDTIESLGFRGFRKLATRHLGEGLKEMHRSFSKAAFTRSLQQLIPEVQSDDLVPCKAGIRAQALTEEGKLVDDFLFVESDRSLHVCNAPSPGATASLEIGQEIVRRLPQVVPSPHLTPSSLPDS